MDIANIDRRKKQMSSLLERFAMMVYEAYFARIDDLIAE